MSDEATVMSALNLRKTSGSLVVLEYMSRPAQFQADVDGTKGPVPGAFTVLRTGTIVDLSQLTIPGFYRVMNLSSDEGNYVEYGIYDPQTDVFYPWGEMGPGESYVGKFSRNLQEEYSGTGTGTTAATNKVMFKAFNASCVALLEAFEK